MSFTNLLDSTKILQDLSKYTYEVRLSGYEAYLNYVKECMSTLCKSDIGLYRSDFDWWYGTAEIGLRQLYFSEMEDKLLKRYFRMLLYILHDSVCIGEFNSMVVLDMRGKTPFGYKIYKKTDSGWRGVIYYKKS